MSPVILHSFFYNDIYKGCSSIAATTTTTLAIACRQDTVIIASFGVFVYSQLYC